jgi:hypothetical protein
MHDLENCFLGNYFTIRFPFNFPLQFGIHWQSKRLCDDRCKRRRRRVAGRLRFQEVLFGIASASALACLARVVRVDF